MDWEAEEYRRAGVDFRAFSLRDADENTVAESVADAHVLIVDQTRVTADLIARIPDLGLIIRHGDGYDNVDVAAATGAGVAVANKPGFWSLEAAEHAMVLTLAVASRLHVQQEVASRTGQPADSPWDLTRVYPVPRLRGRTVGVMGYGRTGSHYARLMYGLGCTVIVHDRSAPGELIREAGFRPVGFDALVQESDVLSLHVPATTATAGLFDARMIGRMKAGSILINTARGSIVVTEDLTRALRSGHIRGAGLDVTDPEPLPADHPLLKMNQVVVTPHLGWYSEEAMWAMRRSILEDVVKFSQGILPRSIVNPEVLPEEESRSFTPSLMERRAGSPDTGESPARSAGEDPE